MRKIKKNVKGELVYGVHPVIELLKAKRRKVFSIYTTKPLPKFWQKIEKLLPIYPVAMQYVSRDALTKMVGTTDHQGVVAWAQSFPLRSRPFDPQKQPFIVMIDSVQDPRNVGAILRSAYCTGVYGVIMTTKNSAPLSSAVFKASAGLAEYLEIQQVSSVQKGLSLLKSWGYTNYLAMLTGEDVAKVSLSLPLCLIIGNEATGIPESMMQYGIAIKLPQKIADVSYNAAVAAGILCFLVGTKHNLI